MSQAPEVKKLPQKDEATPQEFEEEKEQVKPELITLKRSDYYPLGQYEQEDDNEIKPLKTSGLFGLGHVDLSDMKLEKLKTSGNFIPSEIVLKMVVISSNPT